MKHVYRCWGKDDEEFRGVLDRIPTDSELSTIVWRAWLSPSAPDTRDLRPHRSRGYVVGVIDEYDAETDTVKVGYTDVPVSSILSIESYTENK